ncbi:hypothetical protein NPIL_639531 [Nephila pilipes]|uniref:Uncharacterized protein n=1 Tax=Nephila pilipes TaxID=299642 RepID=A0A8X6Q2N6_NEPPI|nr:hypothetical protein NPIL_639531 [Nephila pilipes]
MSIRQDRREPFPNGVCRRNLSHVPDLSSKGVHEFIMVTSNPGEWGCGICHRVCKVKFVRHAQCSGVTVYGVGMDARNWLRVKEKVMRKLPELFWNLHTSNPSIRALRLKFQVQKRQLLNICRGWNRDTNSLTRYFEVCFSAI